MTDLPDNETRNQILQVAEEMFAARGYSAVKLRDIANAVGMKHASLYYYMPGGKEQLFVHVFEYSFERHQRGAMDAIENAGTSIRDQLYAVADWFVTQPAMALNHFQQGDRPKLSDMEVQRLMKQAYDALRTPIVTALSQAQGNGSVHLKDFNLAAMALISLIQSTYNIPNAHSHIRKAVAHQLIDMLMDGWTPR
jgi:AcrR family transcriptional regulator